MIFPVGYGNVVPYPTITAAAILTYPYAYPYGDVVIGSGWYGRGWGRGYYGCLGRLG